MEQIGNSSLYVEKYRPQCLKDLILPKKYISMLEKIIEKGEMPNILMESTAGRGKSSTALVICKELNADYLFINASMENNIDTLRFKVNQFAMTSSFSDGKKIVILDESDRLSTNAMDALKALMELTEANCRFILTTNNLSKIIDPIKSRTQLISFNFTEEEKQEVIGQYFKRCCFILNTENIQYDKKVLAEFVKKLYPDFRKIINELQKAVSMFGCIDEQVYSISADSLIENLIIEMKNKKFVNVQKIASTIDPSEFYSTFYTQLFTFVAPESIPDTILILGEGAYRHAISVDKEINLMSTCVQLMKSVVWK